MELFALADLNILDLAFFLSTNVEHWGVFFFFYYLLVANGLVTTLIYNTHDCTTTDNKTYGDLELE